MKIPIVTLVFILLSNFAFSQTTDELKEFDQFVKAGIEAWEVPGLSVSVVIDRKVIFSEVYGVRNIETREKVDSETMFAIGSTTKALTAYCIALLVDEGKLSFTDKVTDHYPGFQLADPYVTRELQIGDLLTHRAGLANADYLWVMTDFTSEELIDRMKYAKPAYSFRSDFIYQNIMYAVAGEIIHHVSGKPWWEFMQERIFDPLNMKHTIAKTCLLDKSEISSNHVMPHYKFEDGFETIDCMVADQIGAAGSVWASIDDMAKWTKFMLDSAIIGGKKLLSKEVFEELFKPQTIISKSKFYPTAKLTKPNWTTYGYGWFQHDYMGRMVNFHTGSLSGLVAIIGLLHEDKLGVYVMGNADHVELRHAIMYKAFDLFATGGNRNWNEEIQNLYGQIREESTKKKKMDEANRVENAKPAHPLVNYTGRYTSPMWGDITILLEDAYLYLQSSPSVKLKMDHWHYDTFKTISDSRFHWLSDFEITFNTDAGGKIVSAVFWENHFKKVDGGKTNNKIK